MYDRNFLIQMQDYIRTKTGKQYFKQIRENKDNILVSCPIHKEGQENHPSCGFAKINSDKASAGTFHCFSCGFTGNAYSVLKQVLGSQYDKKDIDKKLDIEGIDFKSQYTEKLVLFDIPQTDFIPQKDILQYRQYSQYLNGRNISEATSRRYEVGYDNVTKDITFPIRDKMGRILAVGRRSTLIKRYEYPQGFVKPLYGVFELPQFKKYVWVVERTL